MNEVNGNISLAAGSFIYAIILVISAIIFVLLLCVALSIIGMHSEFKKHNLMLQQFIRMYNTVHSGDSLSPLTDSDKIGLPDSVKQRYKWG